MDDVAAPVNQGQDIPSSQITEEEMLAEERQRGETEPQTPVGNENECPRDLGNQPEEGEALPSEKLEGGRLNQAQQTDSNLSVYKRKEKMDQTQQTEAPGSEKTSGTLLGQEAQKSSQELLGPESQHGSDQLLQQHPQLSQKSSKDTQEPIESVNKCPEEGVVWISRRTSREVTSKGQQTSLIWSRKALAAILKIKPKKSQSGSDSANAEGNKSEDTISITSTESGAAVEQPTAQESRRGSQQPAGQESRRDSQQAAGQESRRGSQQAAGQESRHGSQQPAGQESRRDSQQAAGQESRRGSQQAAGQESRRGSQQPAGQESRRDSQQAAGQESRRGSQQAAGQESRRDSQQAAGQESRRDSQQAAGQESRRGSQQAAGQESRHGSQQPAGQESRRDSQQAAGQESRRDSQQAAGQESRRDSQQAAGQESRRGSQQAAGQESRRDSQQAAGQESRRGSQQPAGQESRRDSQQAAGQESRRDSQQAAGQESRRDSQQAAGQESRRGSQQAAGQESRRDSQQAAGQESRRGSQQAAGQESRRDSQQPNEQESPCDLQQPLEQESQDDSQEPEKQEATKRQKKGKEKADHGQQTDSLLSVAKDLMDQALQTDFLGSEKSSRSSTMQQLQRSSSYLMGLDSQDVSQQDIGKETRQSSQEPLEQESQHSSDQLLRQQSQLSQTSSKDTKEPVQSLGDEYPEEGDVWISRRTSREVTNKGQQTSLIWSRQALAAILNIKPQKSQSSSSSAKAEMNKSEDRVSTTSMERDAPVEQPSGQASQRGSQQSVGQESRRGSQQPTGQESRRGSQQPTGQESQHTSQQEINLVIAKAQQNKISSLVFFEKAQQTYSLISLGGETWINRRTGKVMASHSQQTRESWIQEFRVVSQEAIGLQSRRASGAVGGGKADVQEPNDVLQPEEVECIGPESKKSQSSRRCSIARTEKAQQTYSIVSLEEGSWMNRRTGKIMASHSQQTSDTSVRKHSSTVTQQPVRQESGDRCDADKEGVTGAPEATCPGSDEAGTDVLHLAEHDSANSVISAKPAESEAGQPEGSESEAELQSRASSVEVVDEAQQTYSVVSLEEGLWVNRKTGKLLTSHSQQTSLTALQKPSATAQEPVEQISRHSVDAGEEQELRSDGKEAETALALGQQSRRSSGAAPAEGSEGQQPVVSAHDSSLLGLTSPAEVTDEVQQTYSLVSLEEGTWINRKTGARLKTQSQQTSETCIQKLSDVQRPRDPASQPGRFADGVDLIEIPEPPLCGAEQRDAIRPQAAGQELLYSSSADNAEMIEAFEAACPVDDKPDAVSQELEEQESLLSMDTGDETKERC